MKKNKNPLEGKEIKMQEGLVYAPFCKKCNKETMGFHIVEYGEKFDPRDVEGCVCIHCGKSKFIEWLPEGHSSGEVVMKKGRKANPTDKQEERLK